MCDNLQTGVQFVQKTTLVHNCPTLADEPKVFQTKQYSKQFPTTLTAYYSILYYSKFYFKFLFCSLSASKPKTRSSFK